jgi:hypothetical protein
VCDNIFQHNDLRNTPFCKDLNRLVSTYQSGNVPIDVRVVVAKHQSNYLSRIYLVPDTSKLAT